MREQIELPYQRHSETSREAAESMHPHTARLRAQVLAFIREHGPCTDEEIAEGLEMAGNTERPRRVELVNAGLIRKDGRAKTRSGRSAQRWIVA